MQSEQDAREIAEKLTPQQARALSILLDLGDEEDRRRLLSFLDPATRDDTYRPLLKRLRLISFQRGKCMSLTPTGHAVASHLQRKSPS